MRPNTARPMMLGVVGDSATGKTTLGRGIARLLGPERVTHICGDDYHRYNRAQRAALGITPAHPDCNYLDIMAQHLALLRDGQPILKPVYDHSRGDFGPPEYVNPTPYIIVDGLLTFATPQLRQMFDLRVFLEPQEGLRRRWKIERDVTRRGYSRAQVVAELKRRRAEGLAFIHPQRAFADTIVRFTPRGRSDARLNVKLTIAPTQYRPDLAAFATSGVRLTKGLDAGRVVNFVEIPGTIRDGNAAQMTQQVCAALGLPADAPTVLGQFVRGNDTGTSHPLALTQLLITYHLIRARQDDAKLLRQPV